MLNSFPPCQGCRSGACYPCDASRAMCDNTDYITFSSECPYRSDGDCDDGGPGSEYSSCAYGQDCVDCGTRNGEAVRVEAATMAAVTPTTLNGTFGVENPYQADPLGRSFGDAVCFGANRGPLCALCPEDYFPNEQGLCQPCLGGNLRNLPTSPQYLAILVLLSIFVAIPFVICAGTLYKVMKKRAAAKKAEEEEDKKKDKPDKPSLFAEMKPMLNKGKEGAQLKYRILISMMQIISGVSQAFETDQRPQAELQNFDNQMNTLSAVELNLPRAMPLECDYKLNFDQKMLTTTLIPLVILAIMQGVRKAAMKSAPSIANQCEEYSLVLIFLVYVSCSSLVFDIISPNSCITFTSHFEREHSPPWGDDTRNQDMSNPVHAAYVNTVADQSFLAKDLSIDCNSSTHALYTAWAWLMLLVYPIGTPLLYAFLYRRNYALLKPLIDAEEELNASKSLLKLEKKWTFQRVSPDDPESPVEDTPIAPEDAGVKSAFKTSLETLEYNSKDKLKHQEELPKYMVNLIKPYDFRSYWFETFECLRKIALTGITIFFVQGSVEQLVCALIMCVFLSWVQHNNKPYRSEEDDILAAVCQGSVFMIIVSRIILQDPTTVAIMAQSSDSGVYPGWYTLIEAFLSFWLVAPFVLAVVMTYTEVFRSEERKEFIAMRLARKMGQTIGSGVDIVASSVGLGPAAAPAVVPRAAVPASRALVEPVEMTFTVPPGGGPGAVLAVPGPDGQKYNVTVPAGVQEGHAFTVQMPATPPGPIAPTNTAMVTSDDVEVKVEPAGTLPEAMAPVPSDPPPPSRWGMMSIANLFTPQSSPHPDTVVEPPAVEELPTDAPALPAIVEANAEEASLSISPQQAFAVEPQQAIAVEPQQAIAIEPQQAIAVEPQQTFAVEPQQALEVPMEQQVVAPPVVETIDMSFTVPPGGGPGAILAVPGPDGQKYNVTVPDGVQEGQIFTVQIPASPALQA